MFSWRFLPNLLTVTRIIGVGPLVWFMVAGFYGWAFLFALLSGLSDVLDGYLARRYQWQSHFGGWADPLADKLMLSASYITLAYLDVLPVWLSGLVIGKDLIIILGASVYRYLFGRFHAKPSALSKITTLSQLVLIWLELSLLIGLSVPSWAEYGLLMGVASLTLATLCHYVWVWGTRAWQRFHQHEVAP